MVPRRHPSLLPVVRWWPSAAVFPRCFFSFGLVLVLLSVYFCVRFSWVFALPAYRPWSFIFLPSLWSAFSGGRLRRLIFAVLLRAPSGGGFGPSPFPVLSLAPRSALCFSGLLFLGFVFLPLVPSPPLLSALWPVFLLGSVPRPPARLSSLSLLFLLVLLLSLFPLRFCSLLLGTSFLFGPSLFLVALFPYIFFYFYLFRFVRLKDCGRGG